MARPKEKKRKKVDFARRNCLISPFLMEFNKFYLTLYITLPASVLYVTSRSRWQDVSLIERLIYLNIFLVFLPELFLLSCENACSLLFCWRPHNLRRYLLSSDMAIFSQTPLNISYMSSLILIPLTE